MRSRLPSGACALTLNRRRGAPGKVADAATCHGESFRLASLNVGKLDALSSGFGPLSCRSRVLKSGHSANMSHVDGRVAWRGTRSSDEQAIEHQHGDVKKHKKAVATNLRDRRTQSKGAGLRSMRDQGQSP